MGGLGLGRAGAARGPARRFFRPCLLPTTQPSSQLICRQGGGGLHAPQTSTLTARRFSRQRGSLVCSDPELCRNHGGAAGLTLVPGSHRHRSEPAVSAHCQFCACGRAKASRWASASARRLGRRRPPRPSLFCTPQGVARSRCPEEWAVLTWSGAQAVACWCRNSSRRHL